VKDYRDIYDARLLVNLSFCVPLPEHIVQQAAGLSGQELAPQHFHFSSESYRNSFNSVF
jgi:hypothetical protein